MTPTRRLPSLTVAAFTTALAACTGAINAPDAALDAPASSDARRDGSLAPDAPLPDVAPATPDAAPTLPDAAAPTPDVPRDTAVERDAAPTSPWRLTWSDEFDGPNGSGVDSARWHSEEGGGGWGNNERQFYTTRTSNAAMQDGSLVITARRENPAGYRCWYGDCQYTSARLITRGRFAQRYGRFEARLQIPRGQGIWPAFWMLGTDIGPAGWPACGEIDIMENIGREPTQVHGTIHGPGYSGAAGIGDAHELPGGGRFADGYHVFAVEWDPDAIRWYVDDRLYQTRTPADLPAGARWVFDHEFFLLLNVAVGGFWPGDPDGTTTFPQAMRVDYVRVYTRAE